MEALAESHYGLITRSMARDAGMSDAAVSRRVGSGRWVAVHPGIYRVVGAPVTARQRALAATWWAGDDALLSHAAAGRMLRLQGVPKPSVLDVSVPRTSGLSSVGVRLHQTQLVHSERKIVDRIPCTSGTRTVIDLAAELDDESLETAFESARRLGLTSLPALSRRFETLGGRGRQGSTKIRRLLLAVGSRALDSPLEVKAARLIRAARLPPSVAQFELTVADGSRYRLDRAWSWLRVGAECDGFEHHGTRLLWKRDRRRIAAIEAMNWQIVHLTRDDVTKRPEESIARIAHALRRAA